MSDILCVTNRKLCREEFFTRIEKIAVAKPAGIILREKDLGEKEYMQLATKAVAAGGEATVSLAAQPKGSYLAIIKSAGTVRTHKFLKW